jgi:HEAT repeat protein
MTLAVRRAWTPGTLPIRAKSLCVFAHLRAVACAAACLAASSACSHEPGSAAAAESDAGAAERISALIEAYEQVPADATSDKHDAALRRRRQILEELRGGDRLLGLAAWAAFRASAHERDELRYALLEVAALCDPQGSAPQLERMVVTYDSELGLGLRTRAAELLAETSPERALEVLGSLLTEEEVNATLPSREVMVRAWASAARASGREDLGVLVDVAVDIRQPSEARYAAITALGTLGGDTARSALEEVLFEATSDAYLRRKAAQGLEAFLPPSELCPILERAGSHEHDEVFAQFLSSMMARHCP